MPTTQLEYALFYLSFGWRPIPVHRIMPNGSCSCGRAECSAIGKHPVPAGWQDVTKPMGEKELRYWFGRDPQFNIGLCTGAQSGGLLYLDIDTHHADANGFNSLEKIEREHGKLPVTLTQKTGGGGEGRFFLVAPDVIAKIKNKAGRASIAPGLDLRVSGGQTVVPPSMHVSGRRYEWIDETAEIAAAPAWFVDLCVNETGKSSSTTPAPAPAKKLNDHEKASRKYCLAALENARQRLLEASTGTRNDALNDEAFALGTLIQHGGLYFEETRTALHQAAISIGLGDHEAMATINSGLSSGMKEPKDLSEIGTKRQTESKPMPARIEERINPSSDIREMMLEAERQAQGQMVSIDTPWRSLNRGSDCLRPGTVCVLSGPTKVGKSYFIMNLISAIHQQGVSWRYLPLEDDRSQWCWRMLAIIEGNYNITSTKQEYGDLRQQAVARSGAILESYARNVTQNPRAGVRMVDGKAVVPELPYQMVTDWAARAVSEARVVVIDPLAQIDFNGRDIAREESALVRQLLGCVAGKESTIILVTHVVKRPGSAAAVQLSADDVQGAVNLTRLPQTTLILDAHDAKESDVHCTGGLIKKVMHNRTLLIAAARNAGGTRSRIAFNQSADRPHFEELGVISGRNKR